MHALKRPFQSPVASYSGWASCGWSWKGHVGSSLKETVFREQFLVTHLQVLPRIELGHSVSAVPLTGNSG